MSGIQGHRSAVRSRVAFRRARVRWTVGAVLLMAALSSWTWPKADLHAMEKATSFTSCVPSGTIGDSEPGPLLLGLFVAVQVEEMGEIICEDPLEGDSPCRGENCRYIGTDYDCHRCSWLAPWRKEGTHYIYHECYNCEFEGWQRCEEWEGRECGDCGRDGGFGDDPE
jgi:hypothetical protein